MTHFDKVFEVFERNPTCVLARVNVESGASAATVGFSYDDDLSLVIATNAATRKCEDLRQNPKCAVVVSTEFPATVQYEGVAREITAEELGDRLEKHFERVPAAKRLVGDDQAYFLITPTWLRYRNLGDETQTFETKDFA